MSKCDVCGEEVSMPYHCRHCGGTYCAEHRLPESHDCSGLEDWGGSGPVFDSGFEASVETDTGESGGLADRVGLGRGVGGPLAYLRGNMTYAFLGLMWITFFFQYLVFPFVFNAGPRDDLWRAIFVLTPAHPEFVWTWFTAIFAHGGFGHIAVNSIVIYFFGRLVEDYVGSKEFAYLFLASGAIAGLGQVAVQMIQNPGASAGVLGASGAGLAIMGVLTILNPHLRVYLYFILPIPLWVLTIGYGLISVLGVVSPTGGITGGNVADAAHLIGLLIGLAYGKHVEDRVRVPDQLQFGTGPGGGGPGGPGGPRRRGPF